MSMIIQLRKMVDALSKVAANQSDFDDEAYQARVDRVKAKQKAMFEQMMADGTHLYAKRNYIRGDSNVLREAGLVK